MFPFFYFASTKLTSIFKLRFNLDFNQIKTSAMKYFLMSILIAFPLFADAQEEEVWKDPSAESQAYHEYRLKETTPPYGLTKVKLMISKIQSPDDENFKLNNKDYLALSLREKFTYHMIHPESFSQNCDAMPPIQDEQKKIFGQLPDVFGDGSWSERQTNFLKSNRDSVIAFIKESTTRSKRIGANYKLAIVEMNAKEMIPFLIKTYNADKKDHDILTVLMLLMKNNEYKPFMTSLSYKKLYGDEANYQTWLDFNKANEELILKRASDFSIGY
jgi:hypothetical protein